MGKKNNKSIVNVSKTTERGLPAEPSSHTHGFAGHLPAYPQPGSFTFPFPSRHYKGIPFLSTCGLHFLFYLREEGLWGAVEELSVPG